MNSIRTASPFVTLCVVGVFARLSYAMARTPVLALFAHYLGAPPEGIGLVVGISTVTGIFFKLPAGVLSDIVGRRSMLLIGLCVFAFAPFLYLLVDGYWSLVAVRFLHGFATAVYGPVAMAAVADVAGERKAERLSWFSSLTIIGTLCGAPLGGFVLWWLAGKSAGGGATLSTFHSIYIVVGGFGLIALLVAMAGLRDLKPRDAAPSAERTLAAVYRRFWTGLGQVIRDHRVVVTSSMEGLQNMSLGALEAFLPVYAVIVAGLTPFQAGLLWGIQIIVTLLAKPLMGRLADRHGRKPVVFLGMLLCAAAFATIPLARTFATLIGLAMVFGFGEALVTSSAAAMVADLCEAKHSGAAMGTFGTIFDVGHAAGPIAAGALITAFSGNYFRAFAPIAVMLVLGGFVFLLTVSEKRPARSARLQRV